MSHSTCNVSRMSHSILNGTLRHVTMWHNLLTWYILHNADVETYKTYRKLWVIHEWELACVCERESLLMHECDMTYSRCKFNKSCHTHKMSHSTLNVYYLCSSWWVYPMSVYFVCIYVGVYTHVGVYTQCFVCVYVGVYTQCISRVRMIVCVYVCMCMS